MKHTTLSTLIAVTLAAASLSTQAADAKNGKALHDENCMRCHDTGVYTREDRRVTSLEGLSKQVERCELTLELRWFEDDKADVTGYLNDSFYHF